VASPWLIKNLVQFDNPLYPFLVPSGSMSALRQAFYQGTAGGRSLLEDLSLPWGATMLGIEGGEGYSASIGPVYVALIPALLLGWRNLTQAQRELTRRLICFSVAIWVLWAGFSHLSATLAQARLYWGAFPAFALLAAMAIRGLDPLRVGSVRPGSVARALALLSLFLATTNQVHRFAARNPLPVLAGNVSGEAYVAANLGWYGPAMEKARALPEDARILMLWEARGYYCPALCVPDTIIDRWYLAARTTAGNDELLARWESQGITHVLLHRTGQRFVQGRDVRFDLDDWSRLEALLQDLTVVEDFGGAYVLYDLEG
jgi:hypothetical protein